MKNIINKIINISDNINILGMGEATHGQKKITDLRIKIFKKLVKKNNYTVFVLEEQYSCCELINKYIKTGIGKPKNILKCFSFPWSNIEILNLIKWMRKYNINNNNILEFKGIDCQSICDKYKSNSIINNFVIKCNKKYLKYKNYNERDLIMFKIFMKLYNKTKKYFLYFHMYHLQKKYNTFGFYLYKKFKNKYYAIGNSFYYGSYIGKDIINNDNIKIVKIKKIKIKNKNKLNEGLHINVSTPNYDKKIIYQGNINVNSKYPLKKYTPFFIGELFDAVIIINNEKPFTIIK
tara:strand:- start:156 stop:1031 length:876 start_codon:yes stop_codon:yes gene_type:complete